ncbi:MAG TPA: hypothetical protein VMT89_06300 [Candidatus Acidoferrales bacterium]|nr:hypothetical protein [Candidatus Acidoferrales bacterium]
MALTFIRVCGVLIGLRALTNFAKLFQGSDAVLVFFGQMLHGSTVFVPALLVGLFMLVTAIAMWKPSRLAFPLCAVYAAFVFVNLLTFMVNNPEQFRKIGERLSSLTDPDELQRLGVIAMLVYSALAMATTAGPAWLLWKRRT